MDSRDTAEQVPAPTVEIDDNPLQLPGRDTVVRRSRIGGPDTGMDIRIYFSVSELEAMLDVATASHVSRCELVMAGLESTDYKARSGHVYQVWKIQCKGIRPEKPAIITALGL